MSEFEKNHVETRCNSDEETEPLDDDKIKLIMMKIQDQVQLEIKTVKDLVQNLIGDKFNSIDNIA